MAIEAPEGVQGLFLVLTGERWPTANEDALREVGNAWGTAGDRLESELAPYMVQVVQHIRASFTGKSAIRFADMMAPYVVGEPQYIPQAAAQFQQMKKVLLDAATLVEYVKIISIEELILLIAQIAWVIAMAFWTDGASLTWLAARMAIVRFLLRSWWGRQILQIVLAELFGIAFQDALDVLTQAIQFAKHTRTSWDVKATFSAIEVGAVGGALSLPFSAVSHLLSRKLTSGLTRLLGRGVDVTTVQPVVVRAVNGAARNLGKDAPLPQAAKAVTENLFKAADKPLRIRLTQIGVPAIISMTEEGLHEAITEGVVMAANGQGFQFNPYSFTSGMAGSIAGQTGHGIGTMLAMPKPVREGYGALGDGDGDGGSSDEGGGPSGSVLDDDRRPLLAGGTSGGDPFGDGDSLFGDSHDDTSTLASAPPSSSGPPPVPPKDTGTRTGPAPAVSANGSPPSSHGQETAPPVPAKDTGTRTGQNGVPSRTGTSPTPSRSGADTTSRSSATPPSRANGGATTSSTPLPPSRERTAETEATTPPQRTSSAGTQGTKPAAAESADSPSNRTSSGEGTPVTRSPARENQGGQETTPSRNPIRRDARSSATPPSTARGGRLDAACEGRSG